MSWLEKYQRGGNVVPRDERYANIKTPSTNYRLERQLEELNNIKEDAERSAEIKSIVSNPKSIAYKQKLAEDMERQGILTPHIPQSKLSKLAEIAVNPVTAFGYAARNQRIPDNLSKGERNLHDNAVDVINPAYYVNEGVNLVKNLSEGNLEDAGMNVLGLTPSALGSKTIGTIANKANRTYNTARGGIRNLIEVNAHNPKSIYHNIIRQPIVGDKTSTALFRKAYEMERTPAQATQAIKEEVDKIISGLKPGQQFREKSLSADSFRLLSHKAGALKDEFKVIPTNSYQPLNNLSSLRKELMDKYLNYDDIMHLNGEELQRAWATMEKQHAPIINQEIVKKLTPYTERLARQTGQEILPPKIIAGQVHIPQIILERNGGNLLQEIPRFGKLAKQTSLGFGVANMLDMGLDAAFDDYESEVSKLANKQKKERETQSNWVEKYEQGGVIEDDMGQWAHPGKITKINSNKITMKGVDYPVLGISDTGDKKLMMPGKEYKFKGNSVTEYPLLENQNKTITFTDITPGWLDSYLLT